MLNFFMKIKDFFTRLRDFFTSLYATILLLTGVLFTVLGVGLAILFQREAFSAIIWAAAGSFLGAFLIAAAKHSFPASAASRELAKIREDNQELCTKITAMEEKNRELQHQLEAAPRLTKINPVLKISVAEIEFTHTDFYEEKIEDPAPARKVPLVGAFYYEPRFYRGVYKYTGTICPQVDLRKIKIRETGDAITFYGPFEYSFPIDNATRDWLMPGRVEKETHEGESEDKARKADPTKIETLKIHDYPMEKKQEKMADRQVAAISDPMKPFVDRLVVELVKFILSSSGKDVKYLPEPPLDPSKLVELGCWISEFNARIAAPGLKD